MEVIRVRCPICGALPTMPNLEAASTKPAEIRIIIQRFGGKKPAVLTPGEIPSKTKKGGAPGFMEYEDVTESVPDQVESMKSFFDGRIKLYEEGKGE